MSLPSAISRVRQLLLLYILPKKPCCFSADSVSIPTNRFKLPLTIQDSSSTMDCIAFYTVAEELVECSAVQASQNMQIEPDNQPPVLKTAIGKKKLFHIAISKSVSSKYPIKYILKRSFQIDDQETMKDTPSSQGKNVILLINYILPRSDLILACFNTLSNSRSLTQKMK
jgi:hypothetical protein